MELVCYGTREPLNVSNVSSAKESPSVVSVIMAIIIFIIMIVIIFGLIYGCCQRFKDEESNPHIHEKEVEPPKTA